jgi:DnaJ-domain-containing protein 1
VVEKSSVKEKPHPWDAIFQRSTATGKLAREILGCENIEGKDLIQKAYRNLTKEHHPDRGGDERMMRWLNAAWSYISKLYDW